MPSSGCSLCRASKCPSTSPSWCKDSRRCILCQPQHDKCGCNHRGNWSCSCRCPQSQSRSQDCGQVHNPDHLAAWIKTGVKASELQPTQLKALTLAGNDVLIGKTEAGSLFCVGNLCPHIGTPMSEGADVIGDVIVCPLHGSSFKVTNGELIDWCVSPPIIGPLTGLIVEKKNLLVFEVRQGGFLGSGEVEVLVDTNAKKAYEANYWKGLLDAQGKDDGTYY